MVWISPEKLAGEFGRLGVTGSEVMRSTACAAWAAAPKPDVIGSYAIGGCSPLDEAAAGHFRGE